MKSVHLIISGLVQGVGFRSWMKYQADGTQLTGWVKNRFDGAVEAVIAGDERKVDDMIELCQGGPPGATVHAVKIDELINEAYREFKIIK